MRKLAMVPPALMLMLPGALGGTPVMPGGLTAPPLLARQEAAGAITGRVIDQAGQPCAAVQVFITGSQLGTLSRPDGSYLLPNVPAGTHTLTASRIGYRSETREVTVTQGTTVAMSFQLREEAIALDELVVTGTPGGTQRRALGNELAMIQNLDAAKPPANIEEVLVGRVSGVNMIQGTGQVGAGNRVRIRGISSITLNNQPLIYVDGIRVDNSSGGSTVATRGPAPASRMNDFDPGEIDRIEIVKGAAAATLYGTEASAGVIQIFTKRGSTGAPTFDAAITNGVYYFRDPAGRINWNYQVDPKTRELTKWHVYTTALERDGYTAFQTGPKQGYSLSVRGGEPNLRYYVSGNWAYQEGYVDWNTDQRNHLRGNLDALVNEKLDFSLSLGIMQSNTRFDAAPNPYTFYGSWYVGNARRTATKGYYTITPELLREVENRSRVNRSTWSLTTNYRPFTWLHSRLIVGRDQASEVADLLWHPLAVGASNPVIGIKGLGEKTRENTRSQYTSLDYSATATVNVTPGVNTKTSFGLQYYKNEREGDKLYGQNFALPGLSALDAASVTTAAGSFLENASIGVYAQEEVGLNNRVFLTAAVRGDDNSAFGSSFNAAIYPKFAATWVLSEETFWNVAAVNTFRLRAAWGMAGRQPDVFAATTLYAPQPGPLDKPMVRPGAMGNPDLGPEVSKELEIGFDAGLFDDRVGVTFTHYRQKTKDALLQVPVSMAGGFTSSRWENIGEIQNRGFEVTLDAHVLSTSVAQWDLNVVVAGNRNKVTDLGGVPPSTGNSRLAEGYSVGAWFWSEPVSGEWTGPADPLYGKPVNIMCKLADGSIKDCTKWSRAEFDIYQGDREPHYQGSVTNSLILWDNLTLSVQANYKLGFFVSSCEFSCTMGLHQVAYAVTGDPGKGIAPDPIARWASNIRGGAEGFLGGFDASSVRLQLVSLNYTLPSALAAKVGASRASIRLDGTNLGFIWRATEVHYTRKVIDPDVTQLNAGDYGNSGFMGLPPGTSLQATVNVTF